MENLGWESLFPNKRPCHIGGGVGGEREFHEVAIASDADVGSFRSDGLVAISSEGDHGGFTGDDAGGAAQGEGDGIPCGRI